MHMKAPRVLTWLAALALGVSAIAGQFIHIPVISGYSFYFLAGGFVLLNLGVMARGF